MSFVIMQQIPEMFLVFFESDLPGMLALFLCGIVGWFMTKYFNRRYSSWAKIQAKTKTIDADQCDTVGLTPKTKTRSRRRSNRAPKGDDAPLIVGATLEAETACPSIAEVIDVPDEVDMEATDVPDDVSPVSTGPKVKDDARVAKLMAKKAERKARKLQDQQVLQAEQLQEQQALQAEQQALQAVSPSLASPDAPQQDETGTSEEHCLGETHVMESSPDAQSESDKELDKANIDKDDVHCDSTADELEATSMSEETLNSPQTNEELEAMSLQTSMTTCGDFGNMTSSGASETTPSVDGSTSVCDGYTSSDDMCHLENSIGMHTHTIGDGHVENSLGGMHTQTIGDDGWMTSFEDAPTDPQLPACPEQEPSFVHFDAVTGSEVWFEAVHQNDDGTKFYSDGQQLYQAVCVRVEDLMPNDVAQADGMCFQELPNHGTYSHSQFGDGSFHCPLPVDDSFLCPLPVEDINNGCIFHAQDLSSNCKMVSPTFQDDEEDEAWNMCWDFVSSAWEQ